MSIRAFVLPLILCATWRPAAAEPVPEAHRLPLRFEANDGQADPAVRFIARGGGRTLLVAPGEVIVDRPDVRLRWVGADRHAATTGVDPLPGTANYFIGSDPAKWRTNVRTFARVRQRHLYPGIDLTFYGTRANLEYDFLVSPGADASRIRMAVDGGAELTLDDGGDAVLRACDGELRLRRPRLYQIVGGARRRVAGRYALDRGELSFEIGAYDHRRPLVIDPVMAYSTYLGGAADDWATGVAIDSGGRMYVVGTTYSTDFVGASGSGGSVPVQYFPGDVAGSNRPVQHVAFVVKLDPSKSGAASLVYSTYLGGDPTGGATRGDMGFGIAVDSSRRVFVVGTSSSANFPVTPGGYQTTYRGGSKAFLSVITSAGDALVYSTYFGGMSSDESYSVAIDAGGDAVIAGLTNSPDLPTTAGVIRRSFRSVTQTGFVAKFDPQQSGSASLVFATYLGGSVSDVARSVAVDTGGRVYVTGQTSSPDFPAPGASPPPCVACPNGSAFVISLTPDASAIRYTTLFGGTPYLNEGHSIAVDSGGVAYVVGTTGSVPGPGTLQPFPVTAGALQNVVIGQVAFLTTFDAVGHMIYSTYLGGTFGATMAEGVAVDAAGHAHIVGYTDSSNLPTTVDALQPSLRGGRDAFVAEIIPDPLGTSPLAYASYLGGTSDEYDDAGLSRWGIAGIAVDALGTTYVAGGTISTDFPVTPANALQASATGHLDGWTAKIAKTSLTCSTTGAQGAWTPTGSMDIGRHAFASTATRLEDGGVLVAGGTDSGGVAVRSAVRFLSASGAFTSTGPMTLPRKAHSATLLEDGRVLIAGGLTNERNECARSAELYDPAANGGAGGFRRIASMTYSRAHHTATLLPDGRVLLAGSQGPPCTGAASAEIFDPAANGGAGAFVSAGTLAPPRGFHTATLLTSGSVLVVAGENPTNGQLLASAAIFTPAANGGAWSTTGSMSVSRVWHRATRLPSGRVLVTGGVSLPAGLQAASEIFDPVTGTFHAAASLATGRAGHAAIALVDGRVLVAGGFGVTTTGAGALDSAEIYDETAGPNGVFVAGPHMGAARLFPLSAALDDESVLMAGGVSISSTGAQLLTSAERFIPNNCAPLNTPTGASIVVQPTDTTTGQQPVTATFSDVTRAGVTSVTTTTSGPPPPPNFLLGAGTYYQIATNAGVSGAVTICIDYSGTSLAGTTTQPTFEHFDSALDIWTAVTVTSWDQAHNVICGTVPSLSPFALLVKRQRR